MSESQERRIKSRQMTYKEIYYRTEKMAVFEKARLYNLSHMGALFASERDIELNTKLQLFIPAESSESPNMQLMATVVRKKYHQNRLRKFEYGCRFNYRQSGERRQTNITIKYRTARMNHFENGLLWNLSGKGLLFSSDREMLVDTPIQLVIPPEDPQKPPLQIIADIVRREIYQLQRRKFGYGCRFQQTIDID